MSAASLWRSGGGQAFSTPFDKTREGGLEPTFLLIKESKKLTEEKQAEYDELEKCAEELMMKHYLYCRELVEKRNPEPLKNNVNQIARQCGEFVLLERSGA